MPKLRAVQRKLSPADIQALRIAYLTDPTQNPTALATSYRVSLRCIHTYLHGPEFDRLKTQLHTAMIRGAKDLLYKAAERAARLWAEQALEKAAARGDHRPARDLLAAIDAISVSGGEKPGAVVVQIGLSLSDLKHE